MLDTTQIKQLKQTNVSADGEKTGARVRKVWKNADGADRDAVMALANVALSTVQRAYKTGSLSAKLAVALAQGLHINPFYLAAETDEAEGVFDEEVLNAFLTAHGYDELVQAPKPRRKRAEKTVSVEPDAADISEADAEPEIEIEPIFIVEMTPVPEISTELSDEDVLTLLHALRLKAACGAEAAAVALQKLYGILLG